VFIDRLPESFFTAGTYDPIYGLSVHKYQECRYAKNTELGCQIWTLLDIKADEEHPARVGMAQSIEYRAHRAAWSAPFCPEIDNDRL
jgi:hypothetical protein